MVMWALSRITLTTAPHILLRCIQLPVHLLLPSSLTHLQLVFSFPQSSTILFFSDECTFPEFLVHGERTLYVLYVCSTRQYRHRSRR